jgi:VanZ family protein
MVDFHSSRWTSAAALLAVIRLAFWLVILMVILLTIVPPSIRPGGASHHIEHFASFALAGSLYYLGYAGHLVPRLVAAVLFAGGLELFQILVPGRHARLVDFVMDALGACTGIVLAFALARTFNGR